MTKGWGNFVTVGFLSIYMYVYIRIFRNCICFERS